MKIEFDLTLNPVTRYAFIRAREGETWIRTSYYHMSYLKRSDYISAIDYRCDGNKTSYHCVAYIDDVFLTALERSRQSQDIYTIHRILSKNYSALSPYAEYRAELAMSFDEFW